MTNVDGYAVVVTNDDGKIIEVRDFYFSNYALSNHFSIDQIKDEIQSISTQDAEVLLPLTYHYDSGGYRGGDYDDPSEELYVVKELVLKRDYKQTYKNEILTIWRDTDIWEYVDYMIKDYEELYGEKLNLEKDT